MNRTDRIGIAIGGALLYSWPITLILAKLLFGW